MSSSVAQLLASLLHDTARGTIESFRQHGFWLVY